MYISRPCLYDVNHGTIYYFSLDARFMLTILRPWWIEGFIRFFASRLNFAFFSSLAGIDYWSKKSLNILFAFSFFTFPLLLLVSRFNDCVYRPIYVIVFACFLGQFSCFNKICLFIFFYIFVFRWYSAFSMWLNDIVIRLFRMELNLCMG